MRVITPSDSIVGQNFAYRDWYRGVSANWLPYVSEVYRTAATRNLLVVAISVPIRDEQGKPVGILMAPYALDQLAHKFNDLGLDHPGSFLSSISEESWPPPPAIDPVAKPSPSA